MLYKYNITCFFIVKTHEITINGWFLFFKAHIRNIAIINVGISFVGLRN